MFSLRCFIQTDCESERQWVERFDASISPHPLRDFAITLVGHITLGRTPLDQWSDRRITLYLTTHRAHKRQTSIPGGIRTNIPSKQAATDPR